MDTNMPGEETCDTCGRSGTDLDLETTLEGDSICRHCRKRKRKNTGTRDAGQSGFDSFEPDP
jgi:hypothetical protein